MNGKRYRLIRLTAGMLLVCLFLSGCRITEHTDTETANAENAAAETAGIGTAGIGTAGLETAAAGAEESMPEGSGPAQAETGLETIASHPEGHYTFRPHVFGSCYLKLFGEDMRDTFFAYCDALRNGDDTFPCPDQDTLGWCTGRLSNFFFPAATPYVEAGVCENGTAGIRYLIPKEEFLQKEKEFEEAITGILNGSLGDDYSDLEKILALYEYMTTNYVYDDEMFEHTQEWMDRQSTYRCLTEKKGICSEIAGLYNYLLLQVGIDSEEMGGVLYDAEGAPVNTHSWVFVTLDGESYHIDPTYGLTVGRPLLSYFMMTDDVRESRDGYPKEYFNLVGRGDDSRELFDFEAVNDKYSALWDGVYIGMDRGRRQIVYQDMDWTEKRFSYEA